MLMPVDQALACLELHIITCRAGKDGNRVSSDRWKDGMGEGRSQAEQIVLKREELRQHSIQGRHQGEPQDR